MAQIRNTSGQAVTLPWLNDRLVQKGQTVEVSDEDVYAYTQQDGNWEPVGEETEQLHEAAAIVAGAEQYATDHVVPVEPPGNASRVEWGAFVVAAGQAEPEELADLTRDEIREQYAAPDPGAVVPPKSASKADWVDFVVASTGLSREDAEAMTKDQLQAVGDPERPADESEQDSPDDPTTPGEGDDTEHEEN